MKYLLVLPLLLYHPLAMTSLSDKLKEDVLCLTANLYFEARGEGVKGLKAVADVTLNRVKSKKYPPSVCKVVFQKHQFSWTNEVPWDQIQKALNHVEPSKNPQEVSAYHQAYKEAKKTLLGRPRVLSESVLWYHTKEVKPKWRNNLKVHTIIGSHIFYEPKPKGNNPRK
jgi:N-acetylmuramoyl-L-alanine amidase